MFRFFIKYDNETLMMILFDQKQMKLFIIIDHVNEITFLNKINDVLLKRN